MVARATERLARRRTTVVVAHRLTTAARADRIVYIENGGVAEDGSHQELIAPGGRAAVRSDAAFHHTKSGAISQACSSSVIFSASGRPG